MKYTPGPWVADPKETGTIGSIYDAEMNVVAQAQQMRPRAQDPNQDERKANALLIAAAPTMMIVLQEVVNHLFTKQDMDRVREMAKAAIRAAEGSEHGE